MTALLLIWDVMCRLDQARRLAADPTLRKKLDQAEAGLLRLIQTPKTPEREPNQ